MATIMLFVSLWNFPYQSNAALSDSLSFGPGINLVGNHGYFAKSSIWATREGMDYYLVKGMRVFRIVFAWEWLQPSLDGSLDETTLSGIDKEVDYLNARGAYTIVDMHNFGRRDLNYGKSPPSVQIIGQYQGLTSSHMADCWKKIAMHYINKSHVIFELMNEPHDQSSVDLIATYNKVIAAIRSTGADNVIMIDGNGWSNGGRWISDADNSINMLSIRDPLNNIVFDVHQYFDKFGAGTSVTCLRDAAHSLKSVTEWARLNKKRLFLGEFSGGNNPQCYAEIKNALDTLYANTDIWMGFAWWGSYAGQAPYNSPDNFWYSIDPGGGDAQNFSGFLPDDQRLTILREYIR